MSIEQYIFHNIFHNDDDEFHDMFELSDVKTLISQNYMKTA